MFSSSLQQVREENHLECVGNNSSVLPQTDVEVLSSKLIISEHVYLLPEEAIFLQHALGCLNVTDKSNSLSPDDLWNRFTLKDPDFPIKYAVYYYFRSAGWIVKSGLKFGCDYSKRKI